MMRILSATLFLSLACGQLLHAQTPAFVYQGNLSNGGVPANGNFDFQFFLYGSLSGGSPIVPVLAVDNVAVVNGVFSVRLNFQNQFPGADRFLEISVRPAGQGNHTLLTPRQQLTSTPYSVKSVNAENAFQLGGVTADQFVITTDPRMSDARNPLPNNTSYIQNRTTAQTASNFNISGTGTAGVFSANQYNVGVNRVLSVSGTANTIVGAGTAAGNTGAFNSFFGFNAGFDNISGGGNAFFGASAGSTNTTGFSNSFFGHESGAVNTGNLNTFLGSRAGNANATGSSNTVIGADADVLASNLNFASAIGAGATVGTSNMIVLGRSSGADTVVVPGALVSTTVSAPRLNIAANGGNVLIGDAGCPLGFLGIGFVSSFTGCTNYSLIGNGADTILSRPAGGRIFFRENNSTQMTLAPGGSLGLGTASPAERLHVIGNSFVTGSSTVGSTLTVSGGITVGGELASGSNASFGGSLSAGGAINTLSNFRINGSQVLTRSRLDLFNTAAVPRGFSFEVLNTPSFLVLRNDQGTTIMTVAPDGKVGIGTNNPNAATLEIGGTLAVSNLGGSNGDHLCRDGNVIRACSGAAAKHPDQLELSTKRIAALESALRQQQSEIERQRNELWALKSFICSQSPTAAICGPKQ